MTELSYYWGGTTVGDAAEAPYSDDEFSDLWALLLTYDRTIDGVIGTAYNGAIGETLVVADLSGELEVTKINDATVSIARGAAIVDGKLYVNDTALNLAVGGNGDYRVVLRKIWAAQTVRAVLLGPGAGIPAPTQNDGGPIWEISIATFNKAGGVIGAIVDTREMIGPRVHTGQIENLAVTTGKIDDDAVTDPKLRDSAGCSVIGRSVAAAGDPADIVAAANDRVLTRRANVVGFNQVATADVADDAITPAKIPNRTRRFVVPAQVGTNAYAKIAPAPTAVGMELVTGFNQDVQGVFLVPDDFATALTAQAIYLASGGAGNIVIDHVARYGACAEGFATHSDTLGATTLAAITTLTNVCFADITLASAVAGDIVQILFKRDGAAGGDTYGSSIYFVAWLITYTADS